MRIQTEVITRIQTPSRTLARTQIQMHNRTRIQIHDRTRIQTEFRHRLPNSGCRHLGRSILIDQTQSEIIHCISKSKFSLIYGL